MMRQGVNELKLCKEIYFKPREYSNVKVETAKASLGPNIVNLSTSQSPIIKYSLLILTMSLILFLAAELAEIIQKQWKE